MGSVFFRLFAKLKMVSFFRIPKSIRGIIRDVQVPDYFFQEIFNLPTITLTSSDNLHSDNLEINHSGKKFIYSKELFETSFSDQENSFYIHRFAWIVIVLKKQNSLYLSCYQAILDWIDFDEKGSNRTVYDSYSISERLTNWIFFFLLRKKNMIIQESEIKKIENSIQKQLRYLIMNLEYWGPYTNNHVFNNGRALYIIGRVFKIPTVSQLGKEIIFDYSKILIKSGFVQEDSSHYQLVISRWLIEIYSIASLTEDFEVCGQMKPYLVDSLGACNSLFSTYSDNIPFFGDISPDVSPNFFFGYPFKKIATHVAPIHFFPEEVINLNAILKDKNKLNSVKVDYNLWKKICYEKIEMWIMQKNVGILSHGHNDNGSICIFYKGKPIVIDPGCRSYLKNDSARALQIDYQSHFSFSIDQNPLDVKVPIRFHKNRYASSKQRFYKSINSVVYRSFSYNRKYNFKRKVLFGNNTIAITDSSRVSNQSDYSSSLCVNVSYSSIKQIDNILVFEVENICVEIAVINVERIEVQEIEISEEYGLSVPRSRIRIHARMDKTSCVKFHFSFREIK